MKIKKLIRNACGVFGHEGSDSVLIEDGRIIAVGKSEQLTTPETDVIDADRGYLVPGFIDAHNHFSYWGTSLSEINLEGLRTKQDVLEKISETAAALPQDQPLFCINYEYDFISSEEGITNADLNRIDPDRLYYLNDRTGHLSVTTENTLKAFGISLDTEGTTCCKRAPSFNGIISGKANAMLSQCMCRLTHTPESLRKGWMEAAEAAVRKGVTSIHMICCEEDFPMIMDYRKNLPIHLRIYAETKNVESVYNSGLRQIGGCGKVLVDGDTGPYTAAFREPYLDCPGKYGKLYYTDEELADYVWQAHSRGMQIGLHCVGDAASCQLMDAIEKAQKRDGNTSLRHRIEHFEFADEVMIRRAKDLNIILSLQPKFNLLWPHDGYYASLGKERAEHADMVGSILRAGVPVAFGSDCPVTSCDPLLSIYSAVNHSNPAERIAVKDAILCQTIGGAYAGFEENERGSIDVGKRADLVILDEDPLTDRKSVV